jgi:hypothetical protein
MRLIDSCGAHRKRTERTDRCASEGREKRALKKVANSIEKMYPEIEMMCCW